MEQAERAHDAVEIGSRPLSFEDVVAVARQGASVDVTAAAVEAMQRSRSLVEGHLAGEKAVYGVTTGIGALADTRIPHQELQRLQRNIVRSHAAGAGELLPVEVVRAMILLRARALAAGYSGVRPDVVRRMVDLLNRRVHPAVPSRGSVGASGDLAQLAHVALCITGEGMVTDGDGGHPEAAVDALRRAGLDPLALEAKEGLALINGTEGMLALGILAHHDAALLLATADLTAALSVEGALGTDRPFAEDLHRLRPHPGQAASAANLRQLLQGSPIVASHRKSEHAVQDAYSFRCAPQVHGAARDAHAFAGTVFEREIGSVVDNPVVLPDGRVESTGNFHGQPLAHALDFLAVAMTGVGSIAERRTQWLLGHGGQRGLPPFLSTSPGLGSGYMMAQYTQAALVSECKVLAHPASLDSIPTSGAQEDHVSMGWLAGLKLRDVLEHVRTILAIEAMCAAQAVDLQRPLEPGPGTAAALRALREHVHFLEEDRNVSVDIGATAGLVRSGALVAAAEAVVGDLA
ncbi:MAG TPA: histidine ammonia-lyase [Actinomycetota bacterium]|jgi:histidine ammonia-lyase|nr:histidine ammonia-lyase [Actinomycetota bacterium]